LVDFLDEANKAWLTPRIQPIPVPFFVQDGEAIRTIVQQATAGGR
jgi:hypothetical protein